LSSNREAMNVGQTISLNAKTPQYYLQCLPPSHFTPSFSPSVIPTSSPITNTQFFFHSNNLTLTLNSSFIKSLFHPSTLLPPYHLLSYPVIHPTLFSFPHISTFNHSFDQYSLHLFPFITSPSSSPNMLFLQLCKPLIQSVPISFLSLSPSTTPSSETI